MSSSTSLRLVPLAAFVAALSLVPAASAVDGSSISTFTGGTFNWQTTGNWTGGTVAGGSGAVATLSNNFTSGITTSFDNGSTTTIGKLDFTDTTPSNNSFNLQAGTGNTATLIFADTDGTTNINISQAFGTTVPFQFGNAGTLNIQGTDNLVIDSNSTTNGVRFNTGVNWSGHTGKITLNSGVYQAENANVLPGAAELALGNGVQVRALFNNSRNQSVKGLSGGNASTFFGTNDNSSGDGLLTLGTGTLVSDSYNYSGSLGGDAFTTGSGNENSRFAVTKTGSGTQKFSGANTYIGTTTINGGTLLVNGTHIADTSITANLTATTRGSYIVNSGGTLGGTGTIKPYDTAGGGVIIDIKSGGFLAAGDGGIGTLTLDNTASARSVLNFSTGGKIKADLGAGVTSDKVAIIGSATVGQEVFFNSTIIDFTDLTAGSLSTGDYLLFDGDANTAYSGLTLGSAFSGASVSGTAITAGLTIGTGLEGYSGAQLFQVGNDIYLNVTAVPEPSTFAALAGLGVLGLAVLRRRCRAI